MRSDQTSNTKILVENLTVFSTMLPVSWTYDIQVLFFLGISATFILALFLRFLFYLADVLTKPSAHEAHCPCEVCSLAYFRSQEFYLDVVTRNPEFAKHFIHRHSDWNSLMNDYLDGLPGWLFAIRTICESFAILTLTGIIFIYLYYCFRRCYHFFARVCGIHIENCTCSHCLDLLQQQYNDQQQFVSLFLSDQLKNPNHTS